MLQKNIYLILVIVGILIAVIFFIAGWQLGKSSSDIIPCQEEIKALQTSLEMFFPPLPEEIYSISGKITKVESETIYMQANVRVSRFPLPEGKEIEKQDIKVNVTDQTEIGGIEIGAPILPSLPGEEPVMGKAIILSDIAVGDNISVNSGVNIKGLKEFTANKIQITKKGILIFTDSSSEK